MDILAYAAYGILPGAHHRRGLWPPRPAGTSCGPCSALILTLFGVAGMYFLMAAPVVALMQILIYVGAVSILIFIAIMLVKTGPQGDEAKAKSPRQFVYALLGLAAPAVVLGGTLIRNPLQSRIVPADVSVDQLGKGSLGLTPSPLSSFRWSCWWPWLERSS